VSTWALLPVKKFTQAKSRLSPVLTPGQREQLTRWMVGRVVSVLAQSPMFAGVLVIGERLVDTGLPCTIHLADLGQGPNAAVASGLAVLAGRGASAALVISGDLPLLQADDLAAMMDAAGDKGMAIAPDRRGTGTNGLFLHLPTGFLPSFGPGSLERHLAAATSLGYQPAIVRRLGLALDIDDHADLAMLRRLDPGVDFRLNIREPEVL